MDFENLISLFVILLRVFVPFLILRLPLLGGLLAMFADAIDVMIFEAFGISFFKEINFTKMIHIFLNIFLFSL